MATPRFYRENGRGVAIGANAAREGRVDGYGNAVSPQVGWWIGGRLRAVLHGEEVAA